MRPEADVASQQCFDMGLESGITECFLLLDVSADFGHVVFADGAFEQVAIRRSAGVWHCVDGKIDGVRCYEWIGLSKRVAMKARPPISPWVSDHGRAHGVKFDVPVAGKQIAMRVDQAGLESPLPKRAGAPVSRVETGHVTAAKSLHHP